MNAQIPPFGANPGEDPPLVYVASKLTGLEADGQSVIDGWCSAIRETVERLAADAWYPRLHLPIKFSAPWKDDGLTAGQVYELNSDVLWRVADALIVLTYGGGSLGVGHELTTALQLGVPTLILVRSSDPLSRHIEGMADEYGASCETFIETERLRDIVDGWMRRERRRIDDGPRRRRHAHGAPRTAVGGARARMAAPAAGGTPRGPGRRRRGRATNRADPVARAPPRRSQPCTRSPAWQARSGSTSNTLASAAHSPTSTPASAAPSWQPPPSTAGPDRRRSSSSTPRASSSRNRRSAASV